MVVIAVGVLDRGRSHGYAEICPIESVYSSTRDTTHTTWRPGNSDALRATLALWASLYVLGKNPGGSVSAAVFHRTPSPGMSYLYWEWGVLVWKEDAPNSTKDVLKKHVETHFRLPGLRSGFQCRHPNCSDILGDMMHFKRHAFEVHGVSHWYAWTPFRWYTLQRNGTITLVKNGTALYWEYTRWVDRFRGICLQSGGCLRPHWIVLASDI